jgi:hypothetical protein
VNCKDRNNGRGGRFNNNGYGGRGAFGGRCGRFSGGGNRQPSFRGKCNYCHKVGHKAADCRKRQDEAEEICMMAEEQMALGYCVICGGRGSLGTFCLNCVDSGAIYCSETYEGEGQGNYCEEDDEDEDISDSDISIKDEYGNIQVQKRNRKKDYSIATLTMEQVQNNGFIIKTNVRTSHEYEDRLKRHTTGNTDNGLYLC